MFYVYKKVFSFSSLQRLSSSAPTPTTPPEGGLVPGQLQGGGADLLTMYQSQWATMHHMAVQNASMAEVAIGLEDLATCWFVGYCYE